MISKIISIFRTRKVIQVPNKDKNGKDVTACRVNGDEPFYHCVVDRDELFDENFQFINTKEHVYSIDPAKEPMYVVTTAEVPMNVVLEYFHQEIESFSAPGKGLSTSSKILFALGILTIAGALYITWSQSRSPGNLNSENMEFTTTDLDINPQFMSTDSTV